MSHGVHAVQHEVEHEIKHGDQHAGHGNFFDHFNKKIALLIGVMALFLSLSETLGKSAQTGALSYNIEASNLWAFFQAKNVRRTVVLTAAEGMAVSAAAAPEAAQAAATKQIDSWQKTAARYRSEPEVREGTVELAERAKEAEKKRDTALAKYHHYEIASAAFQIGIVLASATVITGMLLLTWLALGLGGLGLIFTAIGLFAPHAVHLF
ncbi:MAG TPA: DUF4337 domain-containing protein [Hyphomicrobiaceae bacterium]|nr:DUF4337 domain-containing protein [Hyphomicrobiaceae bacterium]